MQRRGQRLAGYCLCSWGDVALATPVPACDESEADAGGLYSVQPNRDCWTRRSKKPVDQTRPQKQGVGGGRPESISCLVPWSPWSPGAIHCRATGNPVGIQRSERGA